MHTITQSLTLAQLREDLERLASAHPGSYPTNVIEVTHQCGEITVDAENEEDALREELKNAEEFMTNADKETREVTARAEKAEEEAQALRAEMKQLHDGKETVATYRERSIAAEQQTQKFREYMLQTARQAEEMERELKALRSRKGVSAGLFKNVHEVLQILYVIAENKSITGERAAEILSRIKNT